MAILLWAWYFPVVAVSHVTVVIQTFPGHPVCARQIQTLQRARTKVKSRCLSSKDGMIRPRQPNDLQAPRTRPSSGAPSASAHAG